MNNMTAPVQAQAGELPKPEYPMVTRVISDAIFSKSQSNTVGCPHCKQATSIPHKEEAKDPVTWIVGGDHPLVADMKVVRMFVDDTGVEVYSIPSIPAKPGEAVKAAMRNLIPMDRIALVEEAMPIDVFIDELEEAESDGGADPDPAAPEPQPSATNGQA